MNKKLIEEIIKPYINKKEEMNRTFDEYKERKQVIEEKINKINYEKSTKIDSYINSALSLGFNSNNKYNVDSHKDLDKEYLSKENKLQKELNELNKDIEKEKSVLIAEFNSIIDKIKVQLLDIQKKILIDLQEKRVELYNVKELIEYEENKYDLTESKNKFTKEISNLSECLSIIDKYLSEFEIAYNIN